THSTATTTDERTRGCRRALWARSYAYVRASTARATSKRSLRGRRASPSLNVSLRLGVIGRFRDGFETGGTRVLRSALRPALRAGTEIGAGAQLRPGSSTRAPEGRSRRRRHRARPRSLER